MPRPYIEHKLNIKFEERTSGKVVITVDSINKNKDRWTTGYPKFEENVGVPWTRIQNEI